MEEGRKNVFRILLMDVFVNELIKKSLLGGKEKKNFHEISIKIFLKMVC